MASPPKVHVLVLCDAAILDPVTGKATLVGLFDRLGAPVFPATIHAIAVFCKMSGLNGLYRLRLQIVAPDLLTFVLDVDVAGEVDVRDPLVPVSAPVNIVDLRIPSPGRYSVRWVYNGAIAEEFSFFVDDPS